MFKPTLYLTIGLHGSGKSFWAQDFIKFNNNTEVVSYDKEKKENEGLTKNKLQDLIYSKIFTALDNNKNVIYDATNLTRQERKVLISKCPAYVNIEAYVIWSPFEVCELRNKSKTKKVSKSVLLSDIKKFQYPFMDEGFSKVELIQNWTIINNISYLNNIKNWDNPTEDTGPCFELCKKNYVEATQNTTNLSIDILATLLWLDCAKDYFENLNILENSAVNTWIACGLPEVNAENFQIVPWFISSFYDEEYQKSLPTFLKQKIEELKMYKKY